MMYPLVRDLAAKDARIRVPIAVACFVAYISSGHNGIYLSQRIAVPKRPGRAHTGMVTLRDTRASRRSRCPSNTVKEHN